MYIFDWIYNKISEVIYNKKRNLLIVGLDNSGKTTLLGLLSNNKISCHEPTYHPNNKKLTIGNIDFSIHDLGGHVAARRLWLNYTNCIDCILFVVDVSDRHRLQEANNELSRFLVNDNTKNKQIIIIGNKIDIHGSCNEQQIRDRLGINIDIKLFMCSIINREGIKNVFDYILKIL